MTQKLQISIARRRWVQGLAGAGVVASLPVWWSGRPWSVAEARETPRSSAASSPSYRFFRPAESAFIDAAVARLIPADERGPGAVQAGVTVFIDRQLAGRYGHAVDWYMGGPWANGTAEQGYQLKRTPAELYRTAIEGLDAHCRQTFAQKAFAAIQAADQDQLLHDLEKDKLTLPGVSGKEFFDMLWQNTKEGFFADPMYEGNRDFIGWKLIGFPGPRYNYVSEIRHFGQAYREPTVGLLGRDPWRRTEVSV